MNSFDFVLCLFMVLPMLVTCRQQRLVVTGTLLCGNRTYSGATVKVISKRMGIDNILGEMESDAKGQFYLDGIADEYFDLKGQVKVYHDCDDELMPCQRRWMSKIPSSYINSPGVKNPKIMNIGTVNLALKAESEERDCIH